MHRRELLCMEYKWDWGGSGINKENTQVIQYTGGVISACLLLMLFPSMLCSSFCWRGVFLGESSSTTQVDIKKKT